MTPPFIARRLERIARELGPGQRIEYSDGLPLCEDCGDWTVHLVTFDPMIRQRARRELVCIGCGGLPEMRAARRAPGSVPQPSRQAEMAL